MLKITISLSDLDALAGLVSEIDVTTSPSLDPRAADVRLESIKQHCAAAHTLIERMAGAHKNALYAEEATS